MASGRTKHWVCLQDISLNAVKEDEQTRVTRLRHVRRLTLQRLPSHLLNNHNTLFQTKSQTTQPPVSLQLPVRTYTCPGHHRRCSKKGMDLRMRLHRNWPPTCMFCVHARLGAKTVTMQQSMHLLHEPWPLTFVNCAWAK